MPAHKRIGQWIGEEISDAANQGFEAFLNLVPPQPTAEEIAEALVENQHWNGGYIIVAALAERLRKNTGFDDPVRSAGHSSRMPAAPTPAPEVVQRLGG